jgi:hypothetical protein
MLTLILGNEQSSPISLISYTALMTVTALPLWLWNRPWQPDEATFELRMAFTTMLGLLFSLHLNPQDSPMFIVPVTRFYAYLRQRNLPRRAFAAFALICPAVIFISEFTVRGRLGTRIPVLVMIVFTVWMARALSGEYRKQRVSPKLPWLERGVVNRPSVSQTSSFGS